MTASPAISEKTEEPKPCPWCQSDNVSLAREDDDPTITQGHYVTCDSCGADGPLANDNPEALTAAGTPTTYGATGWLHSAICNMVTRAWDKIGEKRE